MAEPKRPGRPALPADERRRHVLSVRVCDQTRDMIEVSAEIAGRSISQEVGARVEQSFREDRVIEILAQMHAQLTARLDRIEAEMSRPQA